MSAIPLHNVVLDAARDVLCELRGNRRFAYIPALSFVTAAVPPEHPLVEDIKRLRDVVRTSRSSQVLPPDILALALDPFFRIVTSRDTSGNITGVALGALDEIVRAMLALPAPTLGAYAPALSAIVAAAAGCRFDASDPARDEVVLARITQLVSRIVASPPAVVVLSDSAVLKGFEACLDIAAGRRRTSDLLKRTADATLIDIARALAAGIPQPSADEVDGGGMLSFENTPCASRSSVTIDSYLAGGKFGVPFDVDAHISRGPVTVACLDSILELACKMADPALSRSAASCRLGLQLLSAILTSGGTTLRDHPSLRRLLIRECSRGVLRAVGTFSESPAFISAAFTTASHLVYALGPDSTAFLGALLQKVFPYYISGYEGVLPRLAPLADLVASLPEGSTLGELSVVSSWAAGNAPVDAESEKERLAGGVEIDAIVREVGLEALHSLVSTHGLLASMYQVTDCSMGCGDIVTSLLLALGGATQSRVFRRRSKRLRASTSGSLSSAAVGVDGYSDDDHVDDPINSSPPQTERARRSRAASLLCAETLMAVVDSISERMKEQSASRSQNAGQLVAPPVAGAEDDGVDEAELAQRLRDMRVKKQRLKVTAEAFNDPSFSAKNAARVFKLLQQHGQLGDQSASNVIEDQEVDVNEVIRFLRETPGLAKEKIGVVLGEPDLMSRSVLSAYTDTFQFADRPFTECLRIFLESFRLPGESQKIDRIVESFAERYMSQNQPLDDGIPGEVSAVDDGASESGGEKIGRVDDKASSADVKESSSGVNSAASEEPTARHSVRGIVANADALFTLSFAVVMLNTDQHNPSIKKKMMLEDFVRNMRGINDKKDLPRWFLKDVYTSINAVEIKMSDEAGMRALTDLHWDEQLRDMAMHKRFMPNSVGMSPFDEDIFMVCWPSCISAASAVFSEASSAGSVQKALEGLLNVARCGSSFRRTGPTDTVVSVLSDATSVREGPLYGASVRFGTDIKAQMASVALSGVSRQCGDWMRKNGWMSLVAYILRLHALGLLPERMEESLGGYGEDLTRADGSSLPESTLAPTWWPSQQLRMAAQKRAAVESPAPKQQPKVNGFFALIAASIGGDSMSDDECDSDDEVYHDVPPSYLKSKSPEDSEAGDLARKCISACRIDDILINEAKVLRSDALACLAGSLAQAARDVLDGDAESRGKARVGDGGHDGGRDLSSRDSDSFLQVDGVSGGQNGVGSTGNEVVGSFLSASRDSTIIEGTARVIRSTGSSVESDIGLNGFGGSPQWTGALRARDERKARASVVAFCIDTLCELTLQNRDRLSIPWPALHEVLQRVIDRETRSIALLERAVVALLRVANRLLHRDEVHSDVLRGLNLIVNLPAKTCEELAEPLAAGVYNMVKTYGSHISSVSGWHALLSILESSARAPDKARETGFHALSFLLTDDPSFEAVSTETYAPLLEAVLAYASCPSVDSSMAALGLLCSLSLRIPSLAQNLGVSSSPSPDPTKRPIDRAWAEYWGPLLRGFAAAARDPRGKVRNSALSVLERVIATGGAASHLTAQQWQLALKTVLLPLMEELFTSSGLLQATLGAERAAQKKIVADQNAVAAAAGPKRRSGRGSTSAPDHDVQLMRMVRAACNRTRLQAAMLMSKAFLQHHACIAEGLSEEEFTEIWLGVLSAFRSALGGGTSPERDTRNSHDDLIEHIPESIKNILLVLCASGLLNKDTKGSRWLETFKILDGCLPALELEAFTVRATSPPSPPVPASTVSSAETAEGLTSEEPTSEGPSKKTPVPAVSDRNAAGQADVDGRDPENASDEPSASTDSVPTIEVSMEDLDKVNGRTEASPASMIDAVRQGNS